MICCRCLIEVDAPAVRFGPDFGACSCCSEKTLAEVRQFQNMREFLLDAGFDFETAQSAVAACEEV